MKSLVAFAVCLLLVQARVDAQPAAEVDYEKQIAPLLAKYCVGCHNAEEKEGGLSLENFAQLNQGGEHGPALLAGQAASSRLWRVLAGQAEPKMPPEDNPAPTQDEIQQIRLWIDAGAKGPKGAEPARRKLITPTITSHTDGDPAITSLALAPDGQSIAVARFKRIDIVDVVSRQQVRSIEGLPGKVNSVSFSADGKRLISASGVTGLYGEAAIWNYADGSLVRRITAHRDTLYDAVLSPDGKFVATCSYDRQILLFDADSGEQVRALAGHNDAIYDLAFSPDGSVLASASGDETAKLWSVATGERLDTLSQPEAEQYVVAFSPDGRFILSGGADNRIRVWRFVSKKKRRINPLVYSRIAHQGPVVNLAFTAGGKTLISVAEDKTIKQWETRRFTQTHLFEPQADAVSGISTAPAGQSFVVGRLDGSLGFYAVSAAATRLPEGAEPSPAASGVSVAARQAELEQVSEVEPNNVPEAAMAVQVPATIKGVIHAAAGESAADMFRFSAAAGEPWIVEVNAARMKSPLDSRIEVLDSSGRRVERVLLRAVRDSYFTFRGKNSSQVTDFRIHNWQEMELNEYLFAGGEVVKLWLYPRGPDSGFNVYPGSGSRWTYFDTSPLAHPLHEPAYIVEPHPPGTKLIPNGLPVFPVYYENDDESRRKLGADSKLTFTAPADGEYLVRIVDTRGFEGEQFKYQLSIRPPAPDFRITIGGQNPTVNRGSGKEFSVTVDRIDGYEGPVEIEVTGLPPGFRASSPLLIEAGHTTAVGTLLASADAAAPSVENAKTSMLVARAYIHGKLVEKNVGSLGEIKLADKPKLLVQLTPDTEQSVTPDPDKPFEIVIAPGETITAKVIVKRNGFKGEVSFGKEDSGRNLPHGVYVDNIGLNGLLVVASKSERTFFITAAKWVPETSRLFHLKARTEGNQTSWPMLLHVRHKDQQTQVNASE